MTTYLYKTEPLGYKKKVTNFHVDSKNIFSYEDKKAKTKMLELNLFLPRA